MLYLRSRCCPRYALGLPVHNESTHHCLQDLRCTSARARSPKRSSSGRPMVQHPKSLHFARYSKLVVLCFICGRDVAPDMRWDCQSITNQPIIVYRTCGAPLHAPDPPNDPALECPWSSTRNHFTLRDNRNWLFCALFAVEMLPQICVGIASP